MADLRAVVMRPDLERLGRFDPVRVRQRFLDGYAPARTSVIQVAGADIGLFAVRPDEHALWFEHFYIRPESQGHGLGSAVLLHVIERSPGLHLNVLQGSLARRLYERHGFVAYDEDAVDVWMRRPEAEGA